MVVVVCCEGGALSSHPEGLVTPVGGQRGRCGRGGQDGLVHGRSLALLQDEGVRRGLEARGDAGGAEGRRERDQDFILEETLSDS